MKQALRNGDTPNRIAISIGISWFQSFLRLFRRQIVNTALPLIFLSLALGAGAEPRPIATLDKALSNCPIPYSNSTGALSFRLSEILRIFAPPCSNKDTIKPVEWTKTSIQLYHAKLSDILDALAAHHHVYFRIKKNPPNNIYDGVLNPSESLTNILGALICAPLHYSRKGDTITIR